MRTRLSVFLITLSGLILEVGLTRIYSASIWYHFAFVAISVALLGWGLGGFTVHLWKAGQRAKWKSVVDERGGAGVVALCRHDSAVPLVAGAVSVRDGSVAALFSRAAVA